MSHRLLSTAVAAGVEITNRFSSEAGAPPLVWSVVVNCCQDPVTPVTVLAAHTWPELLSRSTVSGPGLAASLRAKKDTL